MDGDSLFLNNSALAAEIAAHLHDSVAVYRIDSGQISTIFVNDSFCKLTGFELHEVIGEAPKFSSKKGIGAKLHKEVVESIKSESDFDKEIFSINKNGVPFWAQLRSVPLKSVDEHFHILILRDITRIKQKETELKKALADLEESKKMKDRFLANMSHEMRTPINGIMGMAQLLEDTRLSSQQKDYLEELKLSSETLLAIINNILEFNFIESGALKLQSRKFDIRKQLDQVFKTLKERADKKALTLETVVSENVPEILIGDVVRFSQILMHVIGNAIKFTKDGSVQVFVRTIDMGTLRVPIEVKIKDSGIGIPPELLAHVFDSFSKDSRVSMHKYGGTGLGLTIVDQLVKRMDGKIDIQSVDGHGTTFTLTIPFEVPEIEKKKKATEPAIESIPSFSGAKILVVDDYMINRRIIRGMLEKLGNEVFEAEEGESALQMIEKDDFSIVMMDVHMPGMGGLEATRKIRQLEDPVKRNVPIVAITASVLENDIKKCKDAGMDDFIAKPFSKADLVGTVKAHIESGSKEKGDYQSVFKAVDDTLSQPEIDLGPLLEMTGDDKQMAYEMAELFMAQTPELIARIENNFKNKNFAEMSAAAHTVKPTFNYIGLERAFQVALQIEEEGKSKNPDRKKIEELFTTLQRLSTSSIEQLRDKINQLR